MNGFHKLNPFDKVSDASQALPKGFHAGFAIAFATEKAAGHRDLPNGLAQSRGGFGNRFLRQNVSALPLSLVRSKLQARKFPTRAVE